MFVLAALQCLFGAVTVLDVFVAAIPKCGTWKKGTTKLEYRYYPRVDGFNEDKKTKQEARQEYIFEDNALNFF